MASTVDLEDLVPSVLAAVSEPGSVAFPDATTSQWIAKLANAFWDAKLNQFIGFANYTETEGTLSPIDGDDPIDRTLQQALVNFTAIDAIRNKLLNINTMFSAKAGPVEYETQQSAQLLKGILDDLMAQREQLLLLFADAGGYGHTYYFDSYLTRQDALLNCDGVWVR